jgi:integrase
MSSNFNCLHTVFNSPILNCPGGVIAYKREGKKIWEKVGWLSEGYSAKVASQLRAERVRNIRHGEELPKEKIKAPYFREVAEKYLEWATINKTREGRDEKSRYKNNLKERFENKRLNEITSLDLENLKNDLTKEGLAPGTVKHCLMLFRQIFNKAILWGMYKGENPIKGVKLPTLNNQRERFLSHEEADRLLNELQKVSAQLHDEALISLHCGLRAGEIFNLKGYDLDFANGLINISYPKNKESRKAFMTDSPDGYVFKDRKHGEKIQHGSAAYGRTVKKLGFNDGITDPRQKITFHSLRHTFASWLAMQGETILTIKELLGHKTLAMTVRYSHLLPYHKRQAALNLEKAFNNKRNVLLQNEENFE